ncbi:MAG: O-antigen ligase family protein [Burkholderiales bacterium]|nr:O-antigen ligase family protein [Burkholderiales bacterium]
MVAFAPFIRGGNRPLPLAILECAGIAIIAMVAWSPSPLRALPATLRWGAALLIAVPLLQLVPVPMAWWAMIPGHEPYAQVLETAGEASGWRPITLHADATQYSWLVLVPCVAIFLAARRLERTALRRLAMVFVAMACVQAVLGVLQAGSAPGSPITFGNPYGGAGATGTYINKNHFAALMAMALPMLLALWAIEMLPVVTHRGEVLREHPRHADTKFALRALFSTLVVLLLMALLLSRSRAGIAAGLLGFALAIVLLVWRSATVQVKAALAMVAFGAIAFGAYIGLTPALERFAPDAFSMEYRSRMELAAATLRAAFDFLPFGSGLGTFADVFRRYQGGRIVGFADHAHNDYAELILELGVAGVAIIVLLTAAYVMRWREVGRDRSSRRLHFMRVAAGLGMLAMIVHGAFDFNFHIPANAIAFSLLAGIFFFTPAEDRA